MKKIAAIALIATLLVAALAPCAMAYGYYVFAVYGDTHIRVAPDKGSMSVGVLYRGEGLPFSGDVCMDNRGIVWYGVYWGYNLYWVSSYYTEIYY